MSTFGEKLRRERESRNAAVEEIARSARIDPTYLEALERNEFEALPGGAFGKLYIRAYAEVLGFDPASLIDDYDRERLSKAADAQSNEHSASPLRDRSAGSRRARLERLVESRREVERPTGPPAEPLDPEIRRSLRAARDQLRKIRSVPPAEAPPPVAKVSTVETPRDAAVAPVPAPVAAETIPGRLRLSVRPSRGAIAVIAAGLVILAVWMLAAFFGGGEPDVVPLQSVSSAQPSDEAVAAPDPPTADDEAAPASEPEVDAAPPVRTGSLTIPEFGVGQRVVNRRLVGKTDRFEAGSVAWFSTRVLGGEPGDSIRHVWLHEGRAMQSISLELGGSHWRTHSKKTLGQVGEWVVEARDSEDRPLARSSFTCIPAGG